MEVRITTLRVAMAALFLLLAGVGLTSLLSPLVESALANVGQIVNISDHSGSPYFATVDADGALKTKASVSGKVAPAAPGSPWRASANINSNAPDVIAGPSASPINVTSLSISTQAASGGSIFVQLQGAHVGSGAATCSGAVIDTGIWALWDVGDGVTPVSFTFPTPLQWKPPANTKACLLVSAATNSPTIMNAAGFYS